MLDQVTCKHLLHTGPDIWGALLRCIVGPKQQQHSPGYQYSVGSCNRRSGRDRVDKDRKGHSQVEIEHVHF